MSRLSSLCPAILAIFLAAAALPAAAADPAKGMLDYKGRSATLKYAWLVKGPDAVDGKVIRRIVFSATDIGAKVAACKDMSCTDGSVNEGMTVDLIAGPRFGYWVALNNQLVQYSGTEPVGSLQVTADEPKRLAGKIRFDKSAAGGAKVDVEFDVPLVKEFAGK
jgi:hypothetical protein